ncbi:MAG: acyl transferase [Bacteroidetes bacterium]|nr:acyl transferase [Bacteroidota bacterium]MBU1717953.1 acyl transferase [Bacteroidota bacterium]
MSRERYCCKEHFGKISDPSRFEEESLKLFQFQYESNQIYRNFCKALGINRWCIKQITDIPFLPIRFFRTNEIIAEGKKPSVTFFSSSTSDDIPSRHLVADTDYYKHAIKHGFEMVFGDISSTAVIAVLPSYTDRKGASLVYMAEFLSSISECRTSGLYEPDDKNLFRIIGESSQKCEQVILLGVSFALLDIAEKHPQQLPDNVIVMETGGMKGRRDEITREELHERLCEAFGKAEIHSEYGMTELLSQAYSIGKGIFRSPPWMRILIRDIYDPLSFQKPGKTGGVNIIDLANVFSCAFIETSDIGFVNNDLSFGILGRIDTSQIRGCNLMVDQKNKFV